VNAGLQTVLLCCSFYALNKIGIVIIPLTLINIACFALALVWLTNDKMDGELAKEME
jgi:hypothetical protein